MFLFVSSFALYKSATDKEVDPPLIYNTNNKKIGSRIKKWKLVFSKLDSDGVWKQFV